MGVLGKLKEGLNLERTIRNMILGEIAYVEPSALCFDVNQSPYLDLDVVISKYKTSNQILPVERTGHDSCDYDVDIRNIDHKWRLDDLEFYDESRYAALEWDFSIEVSEFLNSIYKKAQFK